MRLTKRMLEKIIELLPDINADEVADTKHIDFQIHKTEPIVFTLPQKPEGIDVDVIRFTKDHKLQDWITNDL